MKICIEVSVATLRDESGFHAYLTVPGIQPVVLTFEGDPVLYESPQDALAALRVVAEAVGSVLTGQEPHKVVVFTDAPIPKSPSSLRRIVSRILGR